MSSIDFAHHGPTPRCRGSGSCRSSELKVDQSLVRDGDEARLSLVAIMVGLIRDRGVRVVAEGVETLEQLHRVRDFGCERAQGFYLSRPVPKAGIDSLVGA